MWVDINTHLELMTNPPYQVLKDARTANVTYIATGTHPEQWRWLEGRAPHVAFGLHPHHLTDESDWLVTLEDLLHRDEQRAVGEIGLDFRRGMPQSDHQIRVFENQLSLAQSLDRAVIIHTVKSHHEVIASLKRVRCERFVIHAFTGSKDIAQTYLSLGGYLSAGGLITREPRPRVVSIFRSIPKERILLETDAPDLPIGGHRHGSPAHLPQIGRTLAKVLGFSELALQQLSTQNAQRLFDYDFFQSN
ncbi:MAG: TatD family hydrolase [Pseudomonadota bacterium]|nr:TatD family hydrolase [Pseudomonadota bacterium]